MILKLKPQQTATVLSCLQMDRLISRQHDEPGERMSVYCLEIWRALYFVFLNHKNGDCFPSYKTLGEVVGCSRRTVAACIKQLRKEGWLRWYRARKHRVGNFWTQAPNRYELCIPRRWRRTVSECKRCARTTSIFIHMAAGQLVRPKKLPPTQPPAPTVVPPNFAANSLAGVEDPQLRAALERLGAAIYAKEARNRESQELQGGQT